MALITQQRVQAVNLLSATTALDPTDPNSVQSISTVPNGIPESTFVFVADENNLYRFNPKSFDAPAAGSVILPGDVLLADPGRWVIVAGGGGGGGSLVGAPLPYVVQPAGSLPDLVAAGWQNAYNSIQDAIDQAVADGHNETDPAVITILPGEYTEAVTVYSGISLVGHGSSLQFGGSDVVEIVGNLTFDADGRVGVCSVENLVVVGQINSALNNIFRPVLRRVVVAQTAAAAAVLYPNAGNFALTCFDCSFVAFNGTAVDMGIGVVGSLIMEQSELFGLNYGVNGSTLVGSIALTETDVQGAINLNDLEGDVTLIQSRFTSENIPCLGMFSTVSSSVLLDRCNFDCTGDATPFLQTDVDVTQRLCTVSGTNQGVAVPNLITNPTFGLGRAERVVVAQPVVAGSGEQLIGQVPFNKLYGNDKEFHVSLEAFCSSSSVCTYRIAFADSGGVDIVTLATYSSDEFQSARTYLNHLHAPICVPPIANEAAADSGAYNINLYATVAGSDMDFNGIASVYGASP